MNYQMQWIIYNNAVVSINWPQKLPLNKHMVLFSKVFSVGKYLSFHNTVK